MLTMSFFFCYIMVAILRALYASAGFWYDGLTLIVQLLFSVLLLVIIVYAFDKFRLKVDFAVTILSIVIAGFMVEIYQGLFSKILLTLNKNKIKKEI
jgi:hypothetical protein